MLVRSYRADIPSLIPPPATGTIEALQTLRARGWRIGIVVDGYAISSVVGARKPDPKRFIAAAEKCSASLNDGGMIGDRADADIAGAIAPTALPRTPLAVKRSPTSEFAAPSSSTVAAKMHSGPRVSWRTRSSRGSVHRFAHPVTLLEYPNAGHGVGSLLPYDPSYLPTGGTMSADQRARAAAWPRLLAFLHSLR